MTVVHMDYKGQVQKKNKRKKCLWQPLRDLEKGLCLKILLKNNKTRRSSKVVDLALERFVQAERLNLELHFLK
jgi:trigger factor